MTYSKIKMTYSKEDIKSFHAKDKRISWLSIFSSLCSSNSGADPNALAELAYKLNDKFYRKYPFPEEEAEAILDNLKEKEENAKRSRKDYKEDKLNSL